MTGGSLQWCRKKENENGKRENKREVDEIESKDTYNTYNIFRWFGETEVKWNKSNVNYYYYHYHCYYDYRAGVLEKHTRRMRITEIYKEKRKKSRILIWYTLHTWNTLIDVWLSGWMLYKVSRISF